MDDYNIVNLDDKDIKILIIMKTSASPFEFVDELQEQLKAMNFSGMVVIDELLHSGNNEERFISAFFDGNSFDNSSFRFEGIAKKSSIRSYICDYLKSNLEVLNCSSLTDIQQKLISHGCVI